MREKRDLIQVLEKESDDSNRRINEIDDLRLRNKNSRDEISNLIKQVNDAKSVETTSKVSECFVTKIVGNANLYKNLV